MVRKLTILGVFICIALVGSYEYLRYSKPVLDDQARKAAPGSFAKLIRGVVHYELAGPEDGKVVVLVHGLTTPFFIWDKTFPALVQAGFRVLRYDHYGRGFSDRPEVSYDHDLFDSQLLELIKTLRLRTPVHLVGLSMGGGVSITFADRHPELVSRVCLISPLGFPMEEPFVRKLALVPLLGDYIMAVAGEGILKNGVRSSIYKFERFPEFMGKFEDQLKYRGYTEAILSTLRNLPLEPLMESYQRVGKQNRPSFYSGAVRMRSFPFPSVNRSERPYPASNFSPLMRRVTPHTTKDQRSSIPS